MGPFPHFDRLIRKPGLLVENRQILRGRKVTRVQRHGGFELADGVIDLTLPAVEQAQVEMQPESQRIDAEAALQVPTASSIRPA